MNMTLLSNIQSKIWVHLTHSPNLQYLMRLFLFSAVAPIMKATGFGNKRRKSVLFSGQAYYNNWYLSRSLRMIGWKADVLNWDLDPENQKYYHGEDYRIAYSRKKDIWNFFVFYFRSLRKYDVFHFANKNGLHFGDPLKNFLKLFFGDDGIEIKFLKSLGKKIVYSNNGCSDGVSQTSFSQWGPENVCSICSWQNQPTVCSDQKNLEWGRFRNEMADYQCNLGGNRVDYNDDPNVHEVPEYYCLDPNVWHPDIEIPDKYKLPVTKEKRVRLYHAVGNKNNRTKLNGVNIKSSHIYLPLVECLKTKGIPVELINVTNISNWEVRYLQAQADIVLDMLSFGWYGANVREAMMLGKPVICYLRPEWLETIAQQIPEFISELPIVSATPNNVERILLELIADEDRRIEIGRRSREFALKWHSAESGARRFNIIYSKLLGINF